jgi:hypothetical protein
MDKFRGQEAPEGTARSAMRCVLVLEGQLMCWRVHYSGLWRRGTLSWSARKRAFVHGFGAHLVRYLKSRTAESMDVGEAHRLRQKGGDE